MKILASAGTVSGILMLVLLLLIPSYKYRGEIKILLYMRFGWHFFDKTDDTDILEKVDILPLQTLSFMILKFILSDTDTDILKIT